jgi:RimJ/RimL family protein N-acetyltransferase
VNDVPHLRTERLDLRLPVAADVAAMAQIVGHAQTARYLGARSDAADHFARFCRNAGSWLLYGYGGFMVRLRGSEEVIGNCGVFHSLRGLGEDFDDGPEAGWILRHDQVGKGLGFEAMSAALEWFDRVHGPRRVVCMTAPENTASIALAGKLGFAPMRDTALPDGDVVRLMQRREPDQPDS